MNRSEVLQPKLPAFDLCRSLITVNLGIFQEALKTLKHTPYAVTLDRAQAIATNTDISKCYSTIKSI